ncbi:MAG: transposase [Nanoarchaeota archaeon]|nr:transposase [Nanoarchaeota archaeon]
MKQTIKYKLNPNKEQEKHLHNLSSIATKLYNTDNYIRRATWKKCGKIPSWYSQKKKVLKNNVWYKLLPSQTAQEVCHNLQGNYNSWFKLRKKDEKARPPKFRRKEMLSPISFYQQFKIIEDKLKLSMSLKYRKEHNIKSLELNFNKWKTEKGIPKFCQVLFNKGSWYANIVYEVPEPNISLNKNIMAIDLGIINTAVTCDNKGNSNIYSGKQILSIQHYFNSRIARVQGKFTKQFPKRKWSKTLQKLTDKKTRQINQSLHTISKGIVNQAKKNNIKTIVAGDLTDIRKDNNFGKRNNQKLHSWSFSKLIQQIEYKSILSGIRFVRVSEENTSKTCSICGTMRKSNRIKRGLYRCKICSNYINSDVNGAKNILKKYLQFFSNEDRSIGNVAMPLVSRIENVIPR